MSEWNFKTFEEKLGKKINYGFILGKSLSGKTTVSKLCELNGIKPSAKIQIGKSLRIR